MEQQSQILASLNPEQRRAVENFEATSLIIAGAGSGKTRVLTHRIAYMIEQGVAPYSILALTFTNKAAREMRERVEKLIGERSHYLWLGTFHAVFAKILRVEGEKLGYGPNYTIYDSAQSQSLIKAIIKELNLQEEQYKPRDVQSRISLAKNNLITAGAYESNAVLVGEDREQRRPALSEIYKRYAARCKANNAMDFDDLLVNINILFRDFPEVLTKYRNRFRYILVDEYQDTNYAQYLILRRLADGEQGARLCVVGDDSQSIYSFRGAKVENILRFRSDFPDARLYKLERNYRSTQTIVNAANSVIEHNQHKIGKQSYSQNSIGEKIAVMRSYTDGEEAQMVASGIRNASRTHNISWDRIAVLYRTNAQSRAIEEALRKSSIPYRIYGGHSFYDHKEIRDLLAYFKLIVNPKDDEAFLRIINYPARGIGEVTQGRLRMVAAQRGMSIWEAITSLTPESPEWSLVGNKVREFVKLISELSTERNDKSLYEFGLTVATRSGLLAALTLSGTPEAATAKDNVEELLNSMQEFSNDRSQIPSDEGEAPEPTIEEWLQNVALLTDMDKEGDAGARVTLMTVHASKGLEFDTVFIVGLEEQLFPSLKSIGSDAQMEEERRLFYVALTRAERQATLSFSQTRYKWGNMEFCKPSRFLKELDQQYLDIRFDPDEDSEDNPLERLRRRYGDSSASGSSERGGYRPYGYQQRSYGAPEHRREATERVEPLRPTHNGPLRKIATQPTAGRVFTSASSAERGGSTVTSASVAENASMSSTGAPLGLGDRVRHTKFGMGKVVDMERLATDWKVTVVFDEPAAGRKTLLNNYAKLEKI